jgi:hypothetical protein
LNEFESRARKFGIQRSKTRTRTATATSAAKMASALSSPLTPAMTGAGRGAGTGLPAGAAEARGAGVGCAGAGARAGAGAEAGAAAATGAAADADGAEGAGAGILIVGAAVGFGGKLIRTVSFLGCTLAASAGRGGTAPDGVLGIFSAIDFIWIQARVGVSWCQMVIGGKSAGANNNGPAHAGPSGQDLENINQ